MLGRSRTGEHRKQRPQNTSNNTAQATTKHQRPYSTNDHERQRPHSTNDHKAPATTQNKRPHNIKDHTPPATQTGKQITRTRKEKTSTSEQASLYQKQPRKVQKGAKISNLLSEVMTSLLPEVVASHANKRGENFLSSGRRVTFSNEGKTRKTSGKNVAGEASKLPEREKKSAAWGEGKTTRTLHHWPSGRVCGTFLKEYNCFFRS